MRTFCVQGSTKKSNQPYYRLIAQKNKYKKMKLKFLKNDICLDDVILGRKIQINATDTLYHLVVNQSRNDECRNILL